MAESEFHRFLVEAEALAAGDRVCVAKLYSAGSPTLEFGNETRPSRIAEGLPSDIPVPDLLIEVPHGATREEDYQILRARLSKDLPEDLIDFFFVNTDVGSQEIAEAVAERVCESAAGLSVLVLRCLVPRTFIDTNRVIDRSGIEESEDGFLSTAFADYIRADADRKLLLSLYERYHQIAGAAHALIARHGGLALTPHTYAPKSVDIRSFDEGIGKALRGAYEPEVYSTWKTRPEVDFITRPGDGSESKEVAAQTPKLPPMELVEAIRTRYEEEGVECAENDAYTLHPASMAHHYSALAPGQVVCFEIRRDLLADPFSPFEEMQIGSAKVVRMAEPIATSVREWLLAR